MKTALHALEQELESKRQALAAAETAKSELLQKLNIDKVDTQEGSDFADEFASLWREIISTTNQIHALEQAIYYTKQASTPN